MKLSYGLLPLRKVDLESDIEALNFSTRVYNALKRNNINTIAQLIGTGVDRVSKIDAIGVGSVDHIKRVLAVHNACWQVNFIKTYKG